MLIFQLLNYRTLDIVSYKTTRNINFHDNKKRSESSDRNFHKIRKHS